MGKQISLKPGFQTFRSIDFNLEKKTVIFTEDKLNIKGSALRNDIMYGMGLFP
jgi:hypothetical protein